MGDSKAEESKIDEKLEIDWSHISCNG